MNTRIEENVHDLCREIDYLRYDLHKAQQEAKEWRERYQALIQNDIAHSQRMAIGMLGLAVATIPHPDPEIRKLGQGYCEIAARE